MVLYIDISYENVFHDVSKGVYFELYILTIFPKT
jgi:hypothetical protein